VGWRHAGRSPANISRGAGRRLVGCACPGGPDGPTFCRMPEHHHEQRPPPRRLAPLSRQLRFRSRANWAGTAPRSPPPDTGRRASRRLVDCACLGRVDGPTFRRMSEHHQQQRSPSQRLGRLSGQLSFKTGSGWVGAVPRCPPPDTGRSAGRCLAERVRRAGRWSNILQNVITSTATALTFPAPRPPLRPVEFQDGVRLGGCHTTMPPAGHRPGRGPLPCGARA
jgi:hypothetical protein